MRKINDNSRFSPAHQNMMSAIVTFALSAGNLAITSTIAAFLAIMNLLKTNLEAIINLQGSINSPVTGVADQKAVIKNSLVQTSALIMQTVYAYAFKNGLSELAAKMKMTASELNKMKDTVLAGTVAGAIESVHGVLAQLATYNITDEVMELWQETLDSFNGIVSNPKVAHDGVDALRNRVQDYLRANMILLYNEADTVAVQFKKNNIDYYRSYRKARKIIPLVKHTKLRVLVTNEQGVPVTHVRVEQDGSTNYVITDLNGRADLYIQIPTGSELPGVYSFTLTKDTLSIKTGDIAIKKGNTVTKNFVMNVTGFIIPEETVVEEKVVVK